MADIQRWDFFGEVGINEPVRYLHLEAVKGRYVTYADHVAAVAAAQAAGRDENKRNYDMGVEHGVQAAHEAVAALQEMNAPMIGRVITKRHALAAIDALRGGS